MSKRLAAVLVAVATAALAIPVAAPANAAAPETTVSNMRVGGGLPCC